MKFYPIDDSESEDYEEAWGGILSTILRMTCLLVFISPVDEVDEEEDSYLSTILRMACLRFPAVFETPTPRIVSKEK